MNTILSNTSKNSSADTTHNASSTFAAGEDVRPEVLVIQQQLKQYRLGLHQGLAEQLAAAGVRYRCAFSLPSHAEQQKGDNLLAPVAAWSDCISSWQWRGLVWQCPSRWRHARVIVVEQANKHLFNWWLLLQLALLPKWCWPQQRKPTLLFWGHGYNHQRPTGFGEWLKKRCLGLPTAWLSYTESVTAYLISAGVPAARITTLHNSLDTRDFAAQVALFRQQKFAAEPASYMAKQQQQRPAPLVLLFCGSLYAEKQLPLLLAVTEALVDDGVVAKLIIVGDGPERTLVTDPPRAWLDYRGACFGMDKARAYAEADLVFNPGLVGLAILDAFAAGLPMITTDFPGHSPEISYLRHEYNGLQLPMQRESLIRAITKLQQEPAKLRNLSAQAKASASHYSLENMVQNFARAVLQYLA